MITSIGKHHDSNYEHCQRHHIACLALEELSSVARDKSKRNNDHKEEQTTTNLKSVIIVIARNIVVNMDIDRYDHHYHHFHCQYYNFQDGVPDEHSNMLKIFEGTRQQKQER